jgi:hypothetical protein
LPVEDTIYTKANVMAMGTAAFAVDLCVGI